MGKRHQTPVCAGLDLSMTNAGMSLVPIADPTGDPLYMGSVETGPKDGTPIERCDFVAATICGRMKKFNVQLIVIEDYAHSRPGSTLGELGGITKRALWKQYKVPNCWLTLT